MSQQPPAVKPSPANPAKLKVRSNGQWLCQSSMHYVRGEAFRYRGRNVCASCRKRLIELTQRK